MEYEDLSKQQYIDIQKLARSNKLVNIWVAKLEWKSHDQAKSCMHFIPFSMNQK